MFLLNTALIFIKKPVIYIRLKDITRVEFHRVTAIMSMRNFDFEVITKNGYSQVFSAIDKRESENVMNYFTSAGIAVKNVKDNDHIDDIMSDDDGDRRDLEAELDAKEDEEDDDDFVVKEDDVEGDEDEDGDYEGED